MKYSSTFDDNTTEIKAKVESFSIDGDKLSLHLKEREKFIATYTIASATEKEFLLNNLKIGLILKLNGEKSEVLGNTIPNTFNYKEYLQHQKIYFVFKIMKLEILEENLDIFSKIKNAVNNRIIVLGNNSYLRAFILGDKSEIDQEQYQYILANGISHLFALSGMHLSLIYMLLSKLLHKLKHKKVFIYLFLFLYLIITGFSISFLRAVLFIILLDVNNILKWNISKIKILFLIAFLLLIYNPFYIYNVGFWYTFIVTFSLLFCNFLICNKNNFFQIVLVSIITFLFSAPISIYINYEINLMTILNNILFVPFISIVVFPLALISFVFPIILPIFNFCVLILEKGNVLFMQFAIPLIFGKIQIIDILIYYFLLIILIKLRLKIIFCFFFLFILFLYNKNIFDTNYYVYFIDVGQGDSALFVSPKNKEVIMIDTGGSITYTKKEYQIRNKEFNLSQNLILFLKSMRIRKIDLLLLTHGDLDHLEYAIDIGNIIPFKKVMINQGEINEEEQKIIDKYKRVLSYQSKMFNYENIVLKVYDNENDNSILTKIKIYDYTFLMMGDVSKTVENDLLEKYKVSVDFLKLGHHGSKTSSSYSFLKGINPKYAIISAGRNNRYNHPSSETINNLNQLKITTLNTQNLGTIQIKISKKGFHIIPTLS